MTCAVRRLFRAVATCSLLLCATATSAAQEPAGGEGNLIQVDAAAEAAAKESLRLFAGLVHEKNFRALGFQALEDVKRATLGEPLASYFVRLDGLRQYSSASRAKELIQRPPHFIFPVLVGGQPRSSIEVALVNGSWKAIRYGSPQVAQNVEKMRGTKIKELGLRPRVFFVVRIPALNVVLLGHEAGTSLLLTPIVNQPAYELQLGGTLPGEVILQRLVPAAQRHDAETPS
jgi:hypothetical protein